MPPAERTFTDSRRRTLLVLLISLAVTIVDLATLRRSDGADWRSWLGLALFGPGTLVFAWLLIRPKQLHLDPDGFAVAGGLVRMPRQVRWADVDGFFIYHLPRGGRMIGFNYVQGARPRSLMGSLNHRLGADGAISRSWVGPPERVVAELNAYRLSALETGRNTPAAFGRARR